MDLRSEINNIKVIGDLQHAMDRFYLKDALELIPLFPTEVHGLDIKTNS